MCSDDTSHTYNLTLKNLCPTSLISWNHISSILHMCASSANVFLLLALSKSLFSNPLDLSTPSHLYPGRIPNLLGGGWGPWYTGMPEKKRGEIKERRTRRNWKRRGFDSDSSMTKPIKSFRIHARAVKSRNHAWERYLKASSCYLEENLGAYSGKFLSWYSVPCWVLVVFLNCSTFAFYYIFEPSFTSLNLYSRTKAPPFKSS